MKTFFLAWRLLQRDWHVGELKILITALIIAVASITSIGLFTHRIDLAMNDQTGRFLGADLVLSSPRPVDDEVINYANKAGLLQSTSLVFSSVVVANEEYQLAQVKAVDAKYPLSGSIKYTLQSYAEEIESNAGPSRGEVWLSQRLLNRLKLQVGEALELGDSRFKVSAILKHDPGQADSFMSIAPRMLMHYDDVEKTGIIQPGSRLTYRYLFSGDLNKREQFTRWLKPKLNPTDRLLGGKEGSPALNTALDRAEQYLSLASMLSVMLAGIAIAMAANRYSLRHFDQTALMRCMGATQYKIVSLYSLQLLILGVLASAIGCLFGYLAQHGLVMLLADLIPGDLPSTNYTPFMTGFISGMVTLIGFGLPAVLRLKSVPPLRVLRRDSMPLPIAAAVVYGLALTAIAGLMWWQSGNFKLTLIVLAGTLLCIFMLAILSILMMSISRHLVQYIHGPWRSGLLQIVRYRRANQLQMLALGLALMILLTILLLRTDLLDRWQAQLPANAPNNFIINIQPYEVEAVTAFLQDNSIKTEGLYPMVRARISAINDVPVLEAVPADARIDEALKRELNISWATEIQENNKLVSGQWWASSSSKQHQISLEQNLAKRLGVELGDRITFQSADKQFSGQVSSLRTVQWDSFQPNFYVIFSPQSISHYPHSFISSFYQPTEKKDIINQMVRKFPGLTVIEVDAIMQQVKLILNQVTLAVEYVMLFVLFAGLVVLLASLQSSMDDRIHTAVIMRALGAKKSYLRKSQLAEFGLLGLFSGLLAIFGTEIIAYSLYTRVFNLSFQLHYVFWLIGPMAGIFLILLTGWLYTRHAINQPPVKVMNN